MDMPNFNLLLLEQQEVGTLFGLKASREVDYVNTPDFQLPNDHYVTKHGYTVNNLQPEVRQQTKVQNHINIVFVQEDGRCSTVRQCESCTSSRQWQRQW